MTFFDYYGRSAGIEYQKGRFGIEIETEVKELASYAGALKADEDTGQYVTVPKSAFWSPKKDNSLRNFGIEFVLKKPHDLDGVKMALSEFESLFAKTTFIKDAPSTSVHVHVNMQNMKNRQIANFITTWTLFENILIEFSGERRRSNLFTLPMRCAEGNIKRIVQLFREFETKKSQTIFVDQQYYKYAALNLASLGHFGTVEIRCFRGETDKTELENWVSILDRIYNFAKSDFSPTDIVARYGQIGFDLFYEVFGPKADVILGVVKDPTDMVERNVFYAAIMADAVADWSRVDWVVEKGEQEVKVMKKRSGLGHNGGPTMTMEQMQNFVLQAGTVTHAPMTDPQPAVNWAILDDIPDFEDEPNF